MRRQQRGVALLVVLWACTLLAILLGGYAVMARTEGLQSSYQFDETRAHYDAEAGVMRAVYALQAPNPADRWIADGRNYPFRFEDSSVTVSVISEGGKVDLNAATADVFTALLREAGANAARAAAVSQAIIDWRSFPMTPEQAGQRLAVYTAAGRDYGPRNAPFVSVEELQMVLGMDATLYGNVAPYVTIWSGRPSPDPATAPLPVLETLPNINPQMAASMIANRFTQPDQSGLAEGNGVTHSIRSEAVLADGTRAVLHATVRLQGTRSGSQSFAVLRWQEGDGE